MLVLHSQSVLSSHYILVYSAITINGWSRHILLAKLVQVTGYFFGVLLILIGIVFTIEFILELSSQSKAPFFMSYQIIGPIIIAIGVTIYYITYRHSKRSVQRYRKYTDTNWHCHFLPLSATFCHFLPLSEKISSLIHLKDFILKIAVRTNNL
jgi:hypothetical protein